MALLTNDWGYPVSSGEMDPNDPVEDASGTEPLGCILDGLCG
jgi:hypothetical protein